MRRFLIGLAELLLQDNVFQFPYTVFFSNEGLAMTVYATVPLGNSEQK